MKERPRKISMLREALANKGKRSFEIQEGEKIGEGAYNTAHRGVVWSAASPDYVRGFVTKRPQIDDSEVADGSVDRTELAKELLLGHIATYTDMKEKGIKHLPATFRLGGIDEGDPVIVMTDYAEGGKKAVLSNNSVEDNTGLPEQIGILTNLGDLFWDIEENARRAARAGYRIPMDAHFFTMPKNGADGPMGFALADFDGCVPDSSKSESELYCRNLTMAIGGLEYVLTHHMKDGAQRKKLVAQLRTELDRCTEAEMLRELQQKTV
jgi:hypothetical protein